MRSKRVGKPYRELVAWPVSACRGASGAAPLGKRVQAGERRRRRDAKVIGIRRKIRQRRRQRRKGVHSSVYKKLGLQGRAKPRIIVEQAMHVLEFRIANVPV